MGGILLAFLLSLFLSLCISRWVRKSSAENNVPPSPWKLPIIGNLHQFGSLPHRKLQALSRKHGPLMLLHFGRVPILVVSSAEAAREIVKTHDVVLANRPLTKVAKKIVHKGKNIVFAPYGEYWRKMRSIFTTHLMSSKRVKSFGFIREEETHDFVKKIRESSGPVDLSNMFAELTCNAICRAAVGRKYSESENGKKFLQLLNELMEIVGTISIDDVVPWLSWISRINGFDKRVEKVDKQLEAFVEDVIQEHVKAPAGVQNGENIVDILLQIQNENNQSFSFDRKCIKAMLMDIFVGGTDTSSTLLEWIMTELLRHPKVMEKLQAEMRKIVKNKERITNDDLEKMFYLKAVIKETLRLHPPVPLLIPRLARRDFIINGYNISAGTIVITNAWAIGRDPASWDEPEKFWPERFLNSSIDFKGLNFELIPFGAGRRGCPGIGFSVAMIEILIANLVHKFNWELPDGAQGKDLDITESPAAATVHKAIPLLAVATEIK